MSSMRNAVQRRNHRERAQPEERQKWGLLEKHKDYTLRARDHGRKKAALKVLKQKALDKNPDEFYFGMVSRSLDAGVGKGKTGTVRGDRGNAVMGVQTVRLLKTQDLGYVRTKRNEARKEVELLEARSKGLRGTGRKVVFVEGVEEQGVKVGEVAQDEDEEEDRDEMDEEKYDRRRMQEKEADKLEAKLAIARERLKTLTEAEQALEIQQAKMAKSPTVGGINKNGVKFKVRERKR